VLAFTPFQKVYATGGNIRAADTPASAPAVRFVALLFCALCATMAG
jgi:ribose/xylose/arabinose/galactoside ABC-type transport system permease subunit